MQYGVAIFGLLIVVSLIILGCILYFSFCKSAEKSDEIPAAHDGSSSRNMPIVVKLPSLAESSVISQRTLDAILSDSKSKKQTPKQDFSKSLKISEFSKVDVKMGKVSMT